MRYGTREPRTRRVTALGEQTERSPLSRLAPSWVPADEVRGEGLFIRFRNAVNQAVYIFFAPTAQLCHDALRCVRVHRLDVKQGQRLRIGAAAGRIHLRQAHAPVVPACLHQGRQFGVAAIL